MELSSARSLKGAATHARRTELALHLRTHELHRGPQALCEELLFRGAVLGLLRKRWGSVTAVLLQAATLRIVRV